MNQVFLRFNGIFLRLLAISLKSKWCNAKICYFELRYKELQTNPFIKIYGTKIPLINISFLRKKRSLNITNTSTTAFTTRSRYITFFSVFFFLRYFLFDIVATLTHFFVYLRFFRSIIYIQL